MRGGPGLGGIQASQGDYFQATKGGGHGDYHLVVYAPASVQEAVDLMGAAFDVADKFRTPAMLIADGIIGQMMEPVELPEMREYKVEPEKKPWAATGGKPGGKKPRAVVNSLYIETKSLPRERPPSGPVRGDREDRGAPDAYNLEGAEIVIAAYGAKPDLQVRHRRAAERSSTGAHPAHHSLALPQAGRPRRVARRRAPASPWTQAANGRGVRLAVNASARGVLGHAAPAAHRGGDQGNHHAHEDNKPWQSFLKRQACSRPVVHYCPGCTHCVITVLCPRSSRRWASRRRP
jgi:hypothetical protein